MGSFLAQARPRPELVLCSSATRAQQTWAAVAAEFNHPPEVVVEDDLYGASALALLARIRRLPEDVEVAMLVGHNPGLEDLAGALAGDGEPVARGRLESKFPTAALATLTGSRAWGKWDHGSGYLESVVTPRELPLDF
jgi:phosphohistidine phosphatase